MSDCCSAPGLIPFDKALEMMLSTLEAVTESEKIDRANGLGRVLAKDIISPVNVPPHDNSAMDGYAFSFESAQLKRPLKIIGRSMAGQPYSGECKLGECVRIMTGAKIPTDCDTVQMQENCHQIDNDSIELIRQPNKTANIRCAGEDIKLGHSVFAKNKKLTVADMGVLASLGIENLTVYRRMTVALLATGDELKLSGEHLQEGDIFESNSQFLHAMLSRFGAEIINFGIIKDDKKAIAQAFTRADSVADVVISSGGVSVGDADYTKEVLEELGDIGFWKIAVKPGKPFAFGKLPNSYFFGLPGNPVSAMVTAHQLVLPALCKLQNMPYSRPLLLKAKTINPLKKSPGRMDFQRGILSNNEQGELEVHSTGSQGSGVLTSMSLANCYIVLPAEQGRVAAGEWVKVQLFDQFIQ